MEDRWEKGNYPVWFMLPRSDECGQRGGVEIRGFPGIVHCSGELPVEFLICVNTVLSHISQPHV